MHLATEERMSYQNISEMTIVAARKFVVADCQIVSTSLAWHSYNVDCHISILFNPSFLVSFIVCLLHV